MNVQIVNEAFAQAQADVRSAAEQIRTTRTRLDRRISGFLGVGWRGTAAESYVAPWGDWVRGATDAEEGLVALAELLHATEVDFRTEDQASQQALDRLSARIIERMGPVR